MNSFWNGYCRYLPYNYDKQIEELNTKLISHIVIELLKELEFQNNYLRDIDITNNKYLPSPINTNIKRNYNGPIIKLE